MEAPERVMRARSRLLLTLSFLGVLLLSAGAFCSVYFLVPVLGRCLDQGCSRRAQETPQWSISGTYQLASFGANYTAYLRALHLPDQAIQAITAMSETMTIKTFQDEDVMEIITLTDSVKRKMRIPLGSTFKAKSGTGLSFSLTNYCVRPRHHLIHCRTEQRENGWKFLSEMKFFSSGLRVKKRFVNKNIWTEKYYRKKSM